jgi:hypothetical protein
MKLRKSRPGGNLLAVISGLSLLTVIAVLFRPSALRNQNIISTTVFDEAEYASVQLAMKEKDVDSDGGSHVHNHDDINNDKEVESGLGSNVYFFWT